MGSSYFSHVRLNKGLVLVYELPIRAFLTGEIEMNYSCLACGYSYHGIDDSVHFCSTNRYNPLVSDPITEQLPEVVNKELKIDPKLASRFDSGKVDWSQLPFTALEGMVKVLEFGAKKYAKGNWANGGGFDHSRVFNSLMRHLVAYQSGEDLDQESGLSHLDHIMCNAMFMAYYRKNAETFNKDDRVNWPKDDKLDKRDM